MCDGHTFIQPDFIELSGPAGSVQLHMFHSNLETIQLRTTLQHKHYSVYSVEGWSFNNDFVLICIHQQHPAAAVNTRGRCSRPEAGCYSLILQNVIVVNLFPFPGLKPNQVHACELLQRERTVSAGVSAELRHESHSQNKWI